MSEISDVLDAIKDAYNRGRGDAFATLVGAAAEACSRLHTDNKCVACEIMLALRRAAERQP